MKTYKNLYYKIYTWENIVKAFQKAKKGKSKKRDIIEFQSDLLENLEKLQFELMTQSYKPRPLKTFILRDPKTRKISKSDFRDRIVHHALCNIIESIFKKTFIYDNCANRKRKGTSLALKRFKKFQRKITGNLTSSAYCLKADIKHYFREINHSILLNQIRKRIKCTKTIWLIKKILSNSANKRSKGIPLGNLTSQFFANIYLSQLDNFVKYELREKYYIRYVDDFIILRSSFAQLEEIKIKIQIFLKNKLELELHDEKSKIILLSHGVDFVGFRNYYYFKLPRKRNIIKMKHKIYLYQYRSIPTKEFFEVFRGWQAYAKIADTYNLRKHIITQTPINYFSYIIK